MILKPHLHKNLTSHIEFFYYFESLSRSNHTIVSPNFALLSFLQLSL